MRELRSLKRPPAHFPRIINCVERGGSERFSTLIKATAPAVSRLY